MLDLQSPKDGLLLNTGAIMPAVGLGTWKSPADKAGQAVECALLEAGYRHIDCAPIYRNEKEIGQAFKKIFSGGLANREDVFITSKLRNSEHARDNVAKACKASLRDLGLDYLDLYLIHWGIATPASEGDPLDENGVLITERIPIRETWEAMEDLLRSGLVKAIGVSNFTGAMLIDLLAYANVAPAVNQIELHPYLQQASLVEFCQYKNIALTAYSPLGSPGNPKNKGLPILTENETISKIAEDHGKSPAQILIRWATQRRTIAIPKSVTPERIKENIGVFDFELSSEEMSSIKSLEKRLRFSSAADRWKIPYFS